MKKKLRSVTMQTNTNMIFLLVLSLVLIFTACEGPSGPQGEQGVQGPEGPVGPAGEDGSTIHAGEGSPAEDLGKTGDFYLDTNAATIYGPKTQDGWGVPISLKGPKGDDGKDGADGQDGENGSQIYAGNGAPDASLGVQGDYYLDKANYDLYGPKTADGWGTPINLQATTDVMYSVWVNIDWGSDDSDTVKDMLFLQDRITEEFLGSGIILMYLKREGFPTTADIQVWPLPRDWSNGHLSFLAQLRTTLGSGRITLNYISTDGAALPDITGLQVRYVLIPGSQVIGSEAPGSNLPIDLKNYQQVKRYFGIKH